MIQYSAALMIDPRRRGVLDARLRGHDEIVPYATSASCGIAATTDWLRPLALAA
jgi:hypothetical protein